jgi:hypothetical protein
MGIEFIFILIELRGQITPGGILPEQRITLFIPVVKIIPQRRQDCLCAQLPGRGNKAFPASDELGAALASSFGRPLHDRDFRLAAGAHIKPIEPLFKNVKRSIRRVNFEGLFFFEEADPEIDTAG